MPLPPCDSRHRTFGISATNFFYSHFTTKYDTEVSLPNGTCQIMV